MQPGAGDIAAGEIRATSLHRAEHRCPLHLSANSPGYLPAKAVFWWEASSWPQRLTIPLRMVLFGIFPGLRRKT